MQKRKVNGEWVTELTKPERKKLADAMVVLSDLEELDWDVRAVHDAVRDVVGRIDEDGTYHEPEVASE